MLVLNHTDLVSGFLENLKCLDGSLLTDAMTLTPCCHKVNKEVAKKIFKGMLDEERVERENACPICKKTVKAYYSDYCIRTLAQKASIIKKEKEHKASVPLPSSSRSTSSQYFSKSLSQDSSEHIKPNKKRTRREQEGSSKKKRHEKDKGPPSSFDVEGFANELQCPVSLELLAKGVTMTPCGHKINEDIAPQVFKEKIIDGGGVLKDRCPLCRAKVKAYYPDTTIRSLAQHILCMQGGQSQTAKLAYLHVCFEKIQKTKPNIGQYRELLNQCVQQKHGSMALSVLNKMQEIGLQPNFKTYDALLELYIKQENGQTAFDVFYKMLQAGLKLNIVTYHQMLLQLYIKLEDGHAALNILDKMHQADLKSDKATYETLFHLFIRLEADNAALNVLHMMHTANLQSSTEMHEALMRLFIKLGNDHTASNYLMHALNLEKDHNLSQFHAKIEDYRKELNSLQMMNTANLQILAKIRHALLDPYTNKLQNNQTAL